MFSHYPLCNFVDISHSAYVHSNPEEFITQRYKAVLEIIRDSNVLAVFSGHMHEKVGREIDKVLHFTLEPFKQYTPKYYFIDIENSKLTIYEKRLMLTNP